MRLAKIRSIVRRFHRAPATDAWVVTHGLEDAGSSPETRVRVAAIQPSGELYSLRPAAQREEVIRNALGLLELAAKERADLALLPERFPARGLWTGGDWPRSEGDDLFERLSATARRHRMAIVAPVSEERSGRLFNSAWVFDGDGRFVGRFCKVHCTAAETAQGVTPGDAWPVFDLGWARVGVMICHDIAFPESARCLMLNGAEIICWPHNQSGWGDTAWDAVVRARAIDNAVYVVCSCVGTPPNEAWRPGMPLGLSGIVAPDGTWLADAGRGVGVALASVSPGAPRWVYALSRGGREDFLGTVLRERRVDTYGALVRHQAELCGRREE